MGTLRIALLLLAALSVTARGATKEPCFEPLSSCPARGCAKRGSPSALTNTLKRNLNPRGELRTLSFEDFGRLQAQVEQLFDGDYSTLTKPDRARLRRLRAGEETVGEGDLVDISGFIAVEPQNSRPRANTSGESVNCRLPGTENNDFHISLTPRPDGSEFEGIVVEMVPQERHENWTLSRLRRVQQARRMVRVRGQLFFDNHHKVNDDPQNNIRNQPKRISLWEIHPVTAFVVCTLPACAAEGTGWQALEEWQ